MEEEEGKRPWACARERRAGLIRRLGSFCHSVNLRLTHSLALPPHPCPSTFAPLHLTTPSVVTRLWPGSQPAGRTVVTRPADDLIG